ncbi:DUF92 domain-containing protein [Chitinophaga sp. 22321]|uniref:DUF92 domain-containing protein n=1 Tax=Chitinophaga hostae TaxID=2831022 RepID=A0ABS5IXM8_9BACT|nr:DUF92 domain-containing protein [Chitinophaga hostae]MBS0027531.1 DUF92 domain-containing protein [Chitinophaga hostae]
MMQLSFSPQLMITAIVVIAIAVVCVKTGKLTVPAAILAVFIAMLVALGAGLGGLILLGGFFILGVTATSHKKQLKTIEGALPPQRRTAGQVFANGGVAAIMGLLAFLYPAQENLYRLMLAASLASATADTLSSELGMVYGRRFYNILTFKKEPKGLDGVISLEGTLLGAAGALLLAVVYGFFFGWGKQVCFVLLAGITGNLVDSVLGATLERRRFIGNDAVNFLNTLLAALVGAGIFRLYIYCT